MKKLLGIFVISALAVSAFAQGTVALQNQTGLVKQWTSASDSTLISVPKGGAYVELISAPVGTQLANSALTSFSSLSGFLAANPGWSLAQGSPPAALMNFGAGLFNGGTLTLQGIAGGANANYVIAGWTGAFPTYEAAFSGGAMIGLSTVFTTATGNPSLTPPGVAVTLRGTFGGLTLAPLAVIPEPSTFALAGLGAAALLIFRRRK